MPTYYSQYQQDRILDQVFFPDSGPGFFLDIGANDGITYSNTYFLEKEKGWKGICVEPLPDTFQKLAANRNCILENCAVGAETRKDVFLAISGYAEMLSGLKSNYNKKHLQRIDAEIEKYGGAKREIEINLFNINELLLKHKVERIDYCNIDTEGSELEILQALDFHKTPIDVLTVEANYTWERYRMLLHLKMRGYKLMAELGSDLLFVHKRKLKSLGGQEVVARAIATLKKTTDVLVS
jgi:FkbM family methyltransferase